MLAVVALAAAAPPVPRGTITHRNIVMALHGLMDHLDRDALPAAAAAADAAIAAADSDEFARLDLNGDGRVFLTEAAAVQAAATRWRRHPSAPRQYAARFVAEHDGDGDGKVQLREFLARELLVKEEGGNTHSVQAYEHRAESAELRREFAGLDRDGDGALGVRELLPLMAPEHPVHAIVPAYELVMAADANGDHELSEEEVRIAAPAIRERWSRPWGYEEVAARLRRLDEL